MSVTDDDALESERLSATASGSAEERPLDLIEQMLTPQQRAALRADLSEIARRRREAEETASLLRLH